MLIDTIKGVKSFMLFLFIVILYYGVMFKVIGVLFDKEDYNGSGDFLVIFA